MLNNMNNDMKIWNVLFTIMKTLINNTKSEQINIKKLANI